MPRSSSLLVDRRSVTLGALAIGGAALSGQALADGRKRRGRERFEGIGRFEFSDWEGAPIRVWYSGPRDVDSSTPVLISLHGLGRDARDNRDDWRKVRGARDWIVLAPEFSERRWPGDDYITAGLIRSGRRPVPAGRTAFDAVERLFDWVRDRADLSARTYGLYGHSAGAQFAHRMVLASPALRADRVVAANAGWYTLPDIDTPWPLGLADLGLADDALRKAFARPLDVLLGSEDTDPRHRNLNRSPEVSPQGPHRYARGVNFFTRARAAARRLETPFAWRLARVEGVGHDSARMAPEALRLMSGQAPREPLMFEERLR